MSDIDKLRTHLFDTLEGVKSGKIRVEQAKAVTEISQQIINSAKAEIDFARVNGSVDSTFFNKLTRPSLPPPAPQEKEVTQTETGTLVREGNSVVHRIK